MGTDELGRDIFSRVVAINLIGTFNVLRLFADRLATIEPIGEERGVVVNTASVAAASCQCTGIRSKRHRGPG